MTTYLISIGTILGAGFILRKIALRFGVPQLLLYMIFGVIASSWINLPISSEIRHIALVVILLRAGLGLKVDELKKVGKASLLLSFVPGVFEGLSVMFIASQVLGISWVEAGMLGFILAAVSPAVVVPAMLWLKERKLGTDKNIPTMILAGASIDDVVAITIFSVFMGMYVGNGQAIWVQVLMMPVSIILGIVLGYGMGRIFQMTQWFLVLPIAIGLSLLKAPIEIATLLSVMVYGMVLGHKSFEGSQKTSKVLNQFWIVAEMFLFMLVGALINPADILNSGLLGVVIIVSGLIFRSVGGWLSLWGSGLTHREKFYVMLSYTPKATVQAAMAGVPLAAGVGAGHQILVISVLSIFITTPIAAIGMRVFADKCLQEEVCELYDNNEN